MSLCFCYAVFCSVFANLGTVLRGESCSVLATTGWLFLCMFWTALLAERMAFSGRLVSSAVGRRPLRGFKNLKRLITAHSARFTHVLGGRCGFMGNTVRMRIPGIYCGSIFAGTMGTRNLAINRPTEIFRHLRYYSN